MADTAIFRQGNTVTLNIPASSGISVWTQGKALIYQIVQGATIPTSPQALLATATAGVPYSSGAFSAATKLVIENFGEYPVFYNVGVTPTSLASIDSVYQPTPGTLNATGTLTAALILGRIVTSTTAAGVTATLDTGTIMDAAGTFAVNDSFDWNVINTGGNTFTVTAAAGGHTVVGVGAVVTVTSASFRTRKTAANTFVTYRLS
jgi:hypothetical protein